MSIGFSDFSRGFSYLPFILFAIFLCAILFIIICRIVSAKSEKKLPVEEKRGRVVTKRAHIWGSNTTNTDYYVTVEFDDGSRTEFKSGGKLYGQLAEGDMGTAFIRGKSLTDFVREADAYAHEEGTSEWHRCPACNAVFKGDTCDYCGTPWMGEK